MSFLAPIDIKNRALDHCGQEPLDPAAEFTDGKKGRLTARVYDQLRQAELRRNTWRFAIRDVVLRAIDINTMILDASLWVASTTYFVGSIVRDQSGQFWSSRIPNNLNNQPETSNTWEQYFGPMTVMLWDSTTAYSSGELVYIAAGDGTSRVYRSLQNINADNPATATAWSATVTYSKNDVVTKSAVTYMSRIDLNLNRDPSTTTVAAWSSVTTYAATNKVTGSDGIEYQSIAGGNLNNDPVLTAGFWTNLGILSPWTTVFVGGGGSIKWRQIGGAEFPVGVGVVTPNITYPIGSGPASQSTTRNVFRLPASFMRKAPTDPTAGSTAWLGASWSLPFADWKIENNFIATSQVDPILLRFVADVVDVSEMDSMFCEGLGARIGLEVCEPLTQSSDKLKTIADIYNKFMGEARVVNGIETGPEEPPTDDFINCRW